MLKNVGNYIKEICDKYNFKTKLTGVNDNLYYEVYSKNTDGDDTLWFDIQISDYDSNDNETFEPKIKIYGNTDQNNIWLYETRKDLSMKDVINFCKDIARICDCKVVSNPTNKENEIYIHHLVDLEDLQELKSDESMQELFNKLDKYNKSVDKLFINSFNIWKQYLISDNNQMLDDKLLNNLKNNFRLGLDGAENELDCLRNEFDREDNKENPFYNDLDNLWDCFNWYKDYLQNNYVDENKLLGLIDDYLYDDEIELDSIENSSL